MPLCIRINKQTAELRSAAGMLRNLSLLKPVEYVRPLPLKYIEYGILGSRLKREPEKTRYYGNNVKNLVFIML